MRDKKEIIDKRSDKKQIVDYTTLAKIANDFVDYPTLAKPTVGTTPLWQNLPSAQLWSLGQGGLIALVIKPPRDSYGASRAPQ